MITMLVMSVITNSVTNHRPIILKYVLVIVALASTTLWFVTAMFRVDKPSSVPDFDNLPLAFEPNVGQTDASVRYLAHGKGGTLYFAPSEVALVLQKPEPEELHTSFQQPNQQPKNDAHRKDRNVVRSRFI
jgi:hypothetical protein